MFDLIFSLTLIFIFVSFLFVSLLCIHSKEEHVTYIHISMSERNLDLNILLSSPNMISFSPTLLLLFLLELRCLCYDLARSWPYSYFLCQSVTKLVCIYTYIFCVSFFFVVRSFSAFVLRT